MALLEEMNISAGIRQACWWDRGIVEGAGVIGIIAALLARKLPLRRPKAAVRSGRDIAIGAAPPTVLGRAALLHGSSGMPMATLTSSREEDAARLARTGPALGARDTDRLLLSKAWTAVPRRQFVKNRGPRMSENPRLPCTMDLDISRRPSGCLDRPWSRDEPLVGLGASVEAGQPLADARFLAGMNREPSARTAPRGGLLPCPDAQRLEAWDLRCRVPDSAAKVAPPPPN